MQDNEKTELLAPKLFFGLTINSLDKDETKLFEFVTAVSDITYIEITYAEIYHSKVTAGCWDWLGKDIPAHCVSFS